MRGVGRALPGLLSEQSTTVSICDFQANLNFSWFGRVGDSAESAGKGAVTLGTVGKGTANRNKWAVQARVESAGRLEDVPVEEIEKICSEVDRCSLSKNPGFLT